MGMYDNLCKIAAEENWSEIDEILPPKYYLPKQKKTFLHKKILAKIGQILIDPHLNIPPNTRIHLFKCLANSCVDGFKQKQLSPEDQEVEATPDFYYETYRLLSLSDFDGDENIIYFPWDGIVEWTANYIINSVANKENKYEEQCKVLQYCLQFLVNFVNSACSPDQYPACLRSSNFKIAIRSLLTSDYLPLASVACLYTQNVLTKSQLPEDFYNKGELMALAEPLLKAEEMGVDIATDTIILMLSKSFWLRRVYEGLPTEHKLYLLQIILEDVRKTAYSDTIADFSTRFPLEAVEFLSDRFKKRSDLILKTVDSYLDDMEPEEVTLLLEILGVVSSKHSFERQILQADTSLIINCIFLLKSLHMAGRAAKNNFSPLHKLSDAAAAMLGPITDPDGNEIQKHPAFGFKAALIRVIGNLVLNNKVNQQVIRDTDAIPLLLDCCNIDMRNPLIMQWTIFAVKNLCEHCPENQEVIRDCHKVGLIDNVALRQLGVKLSEDENGKSIGIVPLPTNE